MLIDRDAIRPNAAKRGQSNCLNSLWGKLAERRNRTQAKLISDPQEMCRFLATLGVEVVNLMFASDSVAWASWRYTAEKQAPSLRHTNEVFAEYVLCGGLMHLYEYLDKLGERALYCDTDNFIFEQKTDLTPLIECDDAFRNMTSELRSNEYISVFVTGGPKNYAYKVCNSVTGEVKTVCKVRSITLNYKALQLVNFVTIKNLVINGRLNSTVMVRTDKKIKRKGAMVRVHQ